MVGLAIAGPQVDFDSSFKNDDGHLRARSSGAEDTTRAVTVQPGGRIVVAGYACKPSMIVGETAMMYAVVYRLKPQQRQTQPL